MDNQWSDKFRDRFEDFEVQVPDDLWDGIELEMSRRAERRRMTVLWGRRVAAVAAAVAVAVLAGVGLFHKEPEMRMELADVVVRKDSVEAERPLRRDMNEPQIAVTRETSVADDETALVAVADVAVDTDVASGVVESDGGVGIVERQPAEEDAAVVMHDSGTEKQPVRKEAEDPAAASPEADVEKSTAPGANDYDRSFTELVYGSKSERPSARRSSRLVAGLQAASLPGSSSTKAGYAMLTRNAAPYAVPMNAAIGQDPMNDIMIYNRGAETTSRIRHRQPVRVGVSLCYNINDRFGLESGVTYTYLSSSLTSGSENNRYETNRMLHYVGIPLSLNVNLWRSRWIDVYVSAGGLMEKCVSGRARTEYTVGGVSAATKTEKVMVDPLQWSVNAAAGLQFNISRFVGLYVEPGVAYAFDNGSDIETIYDKHPFNFDLTVGLRFSFR